MADSSADADLRILIVEDDSFMRSALVAMLESISSGASGSEQQLSLPPLKLKVELAASGEDAWKLLRAGHDTFDIALIDINLPGVSGLDLSWCVREVSSDEADGKISENTILIACTSADMSQKQQQDYGFHDCLQKPVTVTNLRHMIHKWLPRRQIATSSEPHVRLHGISDSLGAGQPRLHVLVVEDDHITCTATKLLLEQVGICPDAAQDGASAMEKLHQRQYDLLLFVSAAYSNLEWPAKVHRGASVRTQDLNLPDMSGYALASWHRTRCRSQGLAPGYVVAISADPDAEHCRKFEIDLCLAKPLSTNTMLALLESFSRHKQGTRDSASAADRRPFASHDSESTITPPDVEDSLHHEFTSGCTVTVTDSRQTSVSHIIDDAERR